MIDELNVELQTADLGVQYGFIIIICLLFMDDIALLARLAKELQEILNMTNVFLNKWNLKFNIKKVQLRYLEATSTKHITINFKLELSN